MKLSQLAILIPGGRPGWLTYAVAICCDTDAPLCPEQQNGTSQEEPNERGIWTLA